MREIPDAETRLSYLLVYAIRYRRAGRTGQPVRAATVEKAMLAVAKGITDLDVPDPRKDRRTGQLYPLCTAFLKALQDDDDPSSRAYPVNTDIIRQLFEVLDFSHPKDGPLNEHIVDLIIVAFFWLLRPAEYTDASTEEARTQAFQF